MDWRGAIAFGWALGFAASCAAEERPTPLDLSAARPIQSFVGMASWYGADFHGRQTADGEIFDMSSLSAAHRTLPLPCYARVTNLRNGRSVVVRVNDRGPYFGGRLIDVSERVAKLLEFSHLGVAKVKVDYLGKALPAGHDTALLLASLRTGADTPAASPSKPTAVAALTPAPVENGITAIERVVEHSTAAATRSPFGELKAPALQADASSSLTSAGLRGALAYADEPAPAAARARSPFGELIVTPFLASARP